MTNTTATPKSLNPPGCFAAFGCLGILVVGGTMILLLLATFGVIDIRS